MKKTRKDIVDFTKAGVTMGVGTMTLAGAESKLPAGAPKSMPGMATAAGMMPMMGTTMMGGNLIRMTKKLKPKKRKR